MSLHLLQSIYKPCFSTSVDNFSHEDWMRSFCFTHGSRVPTSFNNVKSAPKRFIFLVYEIKQYINSIIIILKLIFCCCHVANKNYIFSTLLYRIIEQARNTIRDCSMYYTKLMMGQPENALYAKS